MVEGGDTLPQNVLREAEYSFHKNARIIMLNVNWLDVASLTSTMNVLSKKGTGIAIEEYIPDSLKLSQIQDQIMEHIEHYVNQDLTVITSSLLRLNYSPFKLLQKLNEMPQINIASQQQCLRMLEALAES